MNEKLEAALNFYTEKAKEAITSIPDGAYNNDDMGAIVQSVLDSSAIHVATLLRVLRDENEAIEGILQTFNEEVKRYLSRIEELEKDRRTIQ